MPTGTFYGSADSYERERSLTGPGPASQPKQPSYQPAMQGDVYAASPYQPPAPSPGSSTKGSGQMEVFLPPTQYAPQAPWGQAYEVNQHAGLVESIYGPQQQILADQLARQREQMGMLGLDAEYREDALHRDTDLAKQSIGIDRNLTNTQLANLDKLRAILGKQYGLAGEQLANQMAGFGIDEATVRDMAKRKLFDLRSQLTARGAFGTIANERGTGRVSRDLMYELGQINVGRKGADIAHRGTVLGLDEKGIGYDNTEAGLKARLADLGIQDQKVANSLQDGLHQIGLDSYMSINGLLDAMGSTNAQQAQLAATILGEIAKLSGLPAGVVQQILTAAKTGISNDKKV